MNEAQGAAGTGEAEQTTPTQQQEPKAEKAAALSPLQEAVRKEMGLEAPPKNEEEPPPKEEEPEEQEPEEEESAEPEEEPAEGPQETVTATAEPEQEPEVPEDWPASAKAQITKARRKKREVTQDRDHWRATAENLHAQLQQANARQLARPSPVGEVLDAESLEAERHWEQIRGFTRANPEGADDVFLGKDAQGNEERHDYTREEIIKMGMDADKALSALAARRALLQKERDDRVKARVAEAQKVYPDMFKDTEIGREAYGLLQRAPWILQSEEWALDIGDYLDGRHRRLAKQGKNGEPLSPKAQAILGAPKVAKAPGVIKSRSPSSGPGPSRGGSSVGRVDRKQANEEFYAAGATSEALEERIKRKLAASEAERGGGKQAALV